MKKITLADPKGEVIKFLVRGQRNSSHALEIEIDAKGVLVQNDDVAFIVERLGEAVTVSDVDTKATANDILEEARRAALTDAERAAEDTAAAEKKVADEAKAAEKAAKAAAIKVAKAEAKKNAK